MVHTPPAIAANPLAPAIELARGIPMEIVAAAVGALAGVALFGVVVLVLLRRRSRPVLRAAATDMVFIPPYPVVAIAPSPCQPSLAAWPSPPPEGPSHVPGRPLGFVPSTALSARAFAKMGYWFDEPRREETSHPKDLPPFIRAHRLDELEELEARASSALVAVEGIAASAVAPAPDSIPCVVDSASSIPQVSDVETGPMSAVTMTSSSSILTAAPIADLDLDDGPTELWEPYFDEPLQPYRPAAPAPARHEPLRRMAPPKIRPIPPTPPRQTLLEPAPHGMLPARKMSPSTPLPPVVPPPRT